MSTTCVACTRPTSAFLCQPDTDSLASALRTVGWISEELDVTLSRQDRIGAQQGGGKPGKEVERPLPLNLAAAAAAWDLHYTLHTNVRHLSEVRALTIDCVDTAQGLAAWLVRNINALRHDEAVGEAYEEILGVVDAARRVVDTPVPRQYLLACGADTVHGPCTANLYGRKDRRWVMCPQCQTQHDADERRAQMLEQARGTIGTASELARLLLEVGTKPLNYKRILYIIHRRAIPVLPSADGQARYSLGLILDAHSAMVAA